MQHLGEVVVELAFLLETLSLLSRRFLQTVGSQSKKHLEGESIQLIMQWFAFRCLKL